MKQKGLYIKTERSLCEVYIKREKVWKGSILWLEVWNETYGVIYIETFDLYWNRNEFILGQESVYMETGRSLYSERIKSILKQEGDYIETEKSYIEAGKVCFWKLKTIFRGRSLYWDRKESILRQKGVYIKTGRSLYDVYLERGRSLYWDRKVSFWDRKEGVYIETGKILYWDRKESILIQKGVYIEVLRLVDSSIIIKWAFLMFKTCLAYSKRSKNPFLQTMKALIRHTSFRLHCSLKVLFYDATRMLYFAFYYLSSDYNQIIFPHFSKIYLKYL